MSSITADAPSPPIPPGPPAPLPKRGHPLIAWSVILIAVVVAAGYEQFAAHCSDRVAVKIKARDERAYLSELQVQGREIVGLVREFDRSPEFTEPQIKEGLKHGPYEERLRYVTLVGEMQGPTAALAQLSAMRAGDWKQRPPTEHEAQLTALLEKLYHTQQRQVAATALGGAAATTAINEARAAAEPQQSALTLSNTESRTLREKLDWFGEMALTPAYGADPAARAAILSAARRTALTLFFVAAAVFLMGSLGFFLLLMGLGLLLLRVVRFRFQRGSRDGGIYAETFALWMVVYMGLEVAAAFIPVGSTHMLLLGAFNLVSLLTLGWPVLRGVSWRRVRQDVGWWTPGPSLVEMGWGLGSYLAKVTVLCKYLNRYLVEMGWGLGGYLASLPLVILGVMASAGLMSFYTRFAAHDPYSIPPQATHPIQEMLAHGSWWVCAQIFFVASVCAPIIEETMFRGVLYRHLRELGDRWPRYASVLFSVVAASFVFAVIHPQGFLGVPVLMALAAGFALTRELRGSLLGSMTAHGLNNALVTLVAISMS